MATAVVNGQTMPQERRLKLPERLPELSGAMLAAYRVAWSIWALLAVATLLMSYPHEISQQSAGKAFYAAGLIDRRADAHGVRVSAFSDEAHRQGVGNDALLLSVNGQEAPVAEQDVARLLAGADGSQLVVGLRDANGRTRETVLTRSSSYLRDAYAGTGLTFESRRWTEFAIGVVAQLLMIAAAALLFFRRPKDPVAALLAVAMVANVTNPMILGGASLSMLSLLNYALSLLLFFTAILVFPDGRFSVRWWPIPAIAFLIATAGSIAGHWNLGISAAADHLALAAMSVIVAALFYRYLRSPPGIARQQMKFAVLGFVAVVILAVITQVVAAASDTVADEGVRAWLILVRNLAGALTGAASAAGLLVALLRYRLYDADSVIGRSAAYAVLTAGFVALFAGVEKLAEIIGESYFEHSIGVAAGAVGAAVAASVVVPLHNRVHGWAERRFQKALIRLREGLPEYVSDLRESAPVGQLVAAVMSRVEAGVRSTREAVLLDTDGALVLAGSRDVAAGTVEEWRSGWSPPIGERILECDRHDPLFPLRVRLCIESAGEPETIGWLLLGPRPDGSFFGGDEREALAHVAGPIARAIHIAQLREQREEQAEQRIGALEAMIAKLADSLNPGVATA